MLGYTNLMATLFPTSEALSIASVCMRPFHGYSLIMRPMAEEAYAGTSLAPARGARRPPHGSVSGAVLQDGLWSSSVGNLQIWSIL